MGLNTNDPKPVGISFANAYKAILAWYGGNLKRIQSKTDDYSRGSVALINALRQVSTLSDLEYRAIFGEVICGYLEWAYHQSDGRYKMAAYAFAALEAAGLSFNLTEEEKTKLKPSVLWPYLFFNKTH